MSKAKVVNEVEIWLPIPGYEGYYEVSNLGQVRSLDMSRLDSRGHKFNKKGRLLKFGFSKAVKVDGSVSAYRTVMLCIETQCKAEYVHKLVARAFLPNPNNYPQVNHLDGVKDNNLISNLEWCTASQNMQHAHDTGLKKTTRNYGSTNPSTSLTEADAIEILNLYRLGLRPFLIAKAFKVSNEIVRNIGKRRSWKHLGQ